MRRTLIFNSHFKGKMVCLMLRKLQSRNSLTIEVHTDKIKRKEIVHLSLIQNNPTSNLATIYLCNVTEIDCVQVIII